MREIIEILFYLAGVAMPFIAISAILYAKAQVEHARAQVEEAKKYSEIIAKQARATLLLNLLDQWNSEEMQKAKKLFLQHYSKVQNELSKKLGTFTDQIFKDHFKVVADNLYERDLLGEYYSIMRTMNFFEALGQFVKRDYILLDDVDGLFRGPILQYGAAFESHIKWRQIEKGDLPGLYENALSLISRISGIEKVSS